MLSTVSVSTARWYQVPVNHRGDWLFIELTDTNGLTGYGEASHSGADGETAIVLTQICDVLPGTQIPDQGVPDTALGVISSSPQGKSTQTALSAVAQALTDLRAQNAGQSVAQLLGNAGYERTVPIYTNLNRMCADRSPQTVAQAGRLARASGVSRMKFAPFDELNVALALETGTDPDALLAPARSRLSALRDAVGTDVRLMIDCHWRFPPQWLPALAQTANEFGITWIEDPFPVLTRSLSDQLRDLTGAQVAGGEQFLNIKDFEQYLQSAGVDVLIADVKHVGGIDALNQLCALAAQHDASFAPHNPSGPVSTAASAHVCAANANAVVLEYPFGEVSWRQDFCPAEQVDGQYIGVAGPGLGVSLNWSAIR